MKKYSQHGIINPLVVIIIVAVLAVVSFSAYRIGQSNSSEDSQSKTDTSDIDLAQSKTITEEEKEPSEEVTIPEEEKTVAPVPVKEEPKPVEQPAEKKKTEEVWFQMTKVSAVQDGSVVKIVSKLPATYSGTCHFKFWQDGYDRVYSSTQITNSTECSGQLNVANMPTYDGWSLHVWFDANDGKTHGYQTEEPFPLTNPS